MMDVQTPSKYITLVSADGFEFVVLREAALVSPIIKGMLDVRKWSAAVEAAAAVVWTKPGGHLEPTQLTQSTGQFAEAKDARCVFQEMSAMVLDKVVEYFHYWYRYQNSEDVPDMDIPVELCLELLAAADYLGLDQANMSMK
ncbi:elongin C [Neonectria magnoliae]|uniref:Elongin-C n=1 Tax=Neonectria magnoliae TaxID=2732573 RepID=A0ABR1H986_9HYPO